MFVWTLDTVILVLSVLDLVNGSISIDFSTVSWVLARDISTDGEVTFGELNVVSSVSFAFSAERLAKLFSEDYTLIFSDSNMFVWTSDTESSVLFVLDLVNGSFSIDALTVSWVLARDVSKDR